MVKTASVLASFLIAASALLSVVSGFLTTAALAQVVSQTQPAQPDSPEVRQLFETARKNAGTERAEAFDAKEGR